MRIVSSNNSGVALLLSLIFMVFLITLAMGYLSLTHTVTRTMNNDIMKTKALYLANAGLNKAVWYLKNTAPDLSIGGSWRTTAYPADPGFGLNDPQQENLGDGSYTIWVEDTGFDVLLTGRGEINNVQYTVQHTVTVVPAIVTPVADTWISL